MFFISVSLSAPWSLSILFRERPEEMHHEFQNVEIESKGFTRRSRCFIEL
jgi:hypothetical protein